MKQFTLILVLLALFFGSVPANAGGYASLESVNTNQQTISELESEIDSLAEKLKNAKAMSSKQKNEYEKKLAYLKGLMASLKNENSKLNGSVGSLNTKVLALEAELAKYEDSFVLDNFFGPFITAPLGAVLGAVRGSVAKSLDHSEGFPEALGGGTVANIVGVPTGFLTGLVTGFGSGAAKGLVDGVVVGVRDPLSRASISMEGNYTDFNSYRVFTSEASSI
ncbi:MAG: hypothetical protein MK033_12405 [Candidatus Caenarcaniphilales bacterium]|nr:hypothetical protein [Candidatus Caenarcaniphilales bacterium]